eukprot:1938870-Heterocapsa_arctica.AAC.1
MKVWRTSPSLLSPAAFVMKMAAGMLKVPWVPAVPPAMAASKSRLAESSSGGILVWGTLSDVYG